MKRFFDAPESYLPMAWRRPPDKGITCMQNELLKCNPYKYTPDELILRFML